MCRSWHQMLAMWFRVVCCVDLCSFDSGQMNASKVGGFLMALANTYGLVFIILLLGHGLVKVPRKLWETSFEGRELQRHYFIVTKVKERSKLREVCLPEPTHDSKMAT